MPVYCFTSDDGETIERFHHMDDVPEEIWLGENVRKRKRYIRDLAAEMKGGPKSGKRKGWPIECYASGVHASQAQELRDHLKKHSVPTEVTPNGDPVYRDPQHQKRALACRGIHNNASFGT